MTWLLLVLLSADLQDWKNLEVLKAGDRVGVVSTDMKKVEGLLRSVTENGIEVDGTVVAKDKVVRVYRPVGMSRTKRTLIGAGVGVAVGAVINGTFGRMFHNDGGNFGGINDAGWYAVSVGAGAGIGALSGSGYVTQYQRR